MVENLAPKDFRGPTFLISHRHRPSFPEPKLHEERGGEGNVPEAQKNLGSIHFHPFRPRRSRVKRKASIEKKRARAGKKEKKLATLLSLFALLSPSPENTREGGSQKGRRGMRKGKESRDKGLRVAG